VLDAADQTVGDAAWAALEDGHHRKTGKALGARDISGACLVSTGSGSTPPAACLPERHRLVYQLHGGVVLVWGFGLRQGHAVYRRIAARRPSPARGLTAPDEHA
jgi:hypothetical protein